MANQKLKPTFRDGKAYLEIPDEMVTQLGLSLSPYYFEYSIIDDAILFKAKVDVADLLEITDEQFDPDIESVEIDIK